MQIGTRLNELLTDAGLERLDSDLAGRFENYFRLLQKWNQKTNLTSIHDPEQILRRHFVECIACARLLPADIATLVDFGSGAGLPGIPIALCRPEIEVTLAESQGKKAAFLQEAIRVLSLATRVHSGRAESIGSRFDCVTLRAVDRMEAAVAGAASLLGASGWLALLATKIDQEKLQTAAGPGFLWLDPTPIPGSEQRILALGQREPKDD